MTQTHLVKSLGFRAELLYISMIVKTPKKDLIDYTYLFKGKAILLVQFLLVIQYICLPPTMHNAIS